MEFDLQLEVENLELASLSEERLRLKRSLHEFVKHAWPLVEPDNPFVDNWHIRVLCTVLEGLYRSRTTPSRRVIVNIPPATLKSLLIAVFFPCWVWAKNPSARFFTASYGAHLTTRDNLRVRQIVESAWFQKLYPFKLDEDQNTKTRFNTSKGGWRIASSVGGVGTGEHPDYIIIDDALSAQQAESEQERDSANLWFDRTVSTRGIAKGVSIIVVGQRLHELDLPGYLKSRGGWETVIFPMRYEVSRAADPEMGDQGHVADPLDPRTVEGELLFPTLFDEAKVRLLEVDLGAYGTAGQLQQRPAPAGGGMFQRDWFRYTDRTPGNAVRVRGWDTASTEGGGDWTVGVKMAVVSTVKMMGPDVPPRVTKQFYIEDVIRGQWSPANVDAAMRAAAEMDGKPCAVREEREGGAAGKSVVVARAQLLLGFDYSFVPVTGDKTTRAKPFRSMAEAGCVTLVRGEWNGMFLRELSDFPNGKHDDQVDAGSTAFNALVGRQLVTMDNCDFGVGCSGERPSFMDRTVRRAL